ncbi:hypothetical protein IM697_42455 [Streptomyces ferrugineus]|uniref:Uncharacterized protein n=1 Tax=Streptomyces ferrugineus TaxID=1413221 RepID=A0A7M2SMW6_9ACTN|nr:hypothetical protein [Streptomyces ferrugineus]QOV36571.1 hypothetical protein IM697_42455 [Streptomyces ferrugineus]
MDRIEKTLRKGNTMLSREIKIQLCYWSGQSSDSTETAAARRQLHQIRTSRLQALAQLHGALGEEQLDWQARRFPVLAALAPVMTSVEGEITYPGDPMCLYAALSVTVDSALRSARHGVGGNSPFTDLCPDWGKLPTKLQRLAATHGVRSWNTDESTPDRSVFDPRVWDDEAREDFRAELARCRPRVFLISTVSPGHRYALEMARMVKRETPECLVVLGGRHIDETMRYVPAAQRLSLEYSSTLRAIDDGRIEPVVDFLVSGEGHYALDMLMRAIALSMDLNRTRAEVADVVRMLGLLGQAGEKVSGSSLICAVTPEEVHAFPIRGDRFDLADLPSPYQGFGIRSASRSSPMLTGCRPAPPT